MTLMIRLCRLIISLKLYLLPLQNNNVSRRKILLSLITKFYTSSVLLGREQKDGSLDRSIDMKLRDVLNMYQATYYETPTPY